MSSSTLLKTEQAQEAFTQLYSQYNKLVYFISMEQLKSRELAEDCTQEVFMYIAKNFDTIQNQSEEALKGYIATVAKSIAINMYRKARRESVVTNEDLANLIDINNLNFNEE